MAIAYQDRNNIISLVNILVCYHRYGIKFFTLIINGCLSYTLTLFNRSLNYT